MKLYICIICVFLTACGKSNNSSSEASLSSGQQDQQYIVVLKKSSVQAAMQKTAIKNGARGAAVVGMINTISGNHGVVALKIFSVALKGGVYRMSEQQAQAMAADPDVAYVEKDHVITVNSARSPASWGPDRLDQVSLPLNQQYNFLDSGSQVNAYVIDTGILTTHVEFEGRAVHGVDLVDKDNDSTDCNGHGTHVAGTIGSSSFGVLKNVKLVGVRVLNCFGSGQFSDVIAGIEWVTANHVKPAVANMSLGGPVSQAVDDAIAASIKAGVTYVVAAGNSNTDACSTSPARVPAAITVGSTTSTDARSSFSNFGSCVDVFAPGSDILSTWFDSDSSTNTISGTSMASPHVAGVAALYLAQHPTAKPDEVAAAIVAGSLSGKVSNAGSGSPNLLANTLFVSESDNGGGGGDVDDSKLKNGVAVTELAGLRGEERHFTVEVPAGSTRLIINMEGGIGDADLYVKKSSAPTTTSYGCRPYRSGNLESCSMGRAGGSVYHVMIRGYSAYSGVSIKATLR